MRMPQVHGVIDRRILVNYRVRPKAMARVLPEPFRPHTVDGWAVAGICLIRLTGIRPRPLPAWMGIGSENAAHRVAVEWDRGGATHRGVYIPRRDTSSRLNAMVGGKLFPGLHHHARFDVAESGGRYRVEMTSDDGVAHLLVEGAPADALPADSIFGALSDASAFFEAGSLGYSDTDRPGEFDGLELACENWHVQPLAVERVESSFFGDRARFAAGEAEFDHALLMRDIAHAWHSRENLYCGQGRSVPA